MAALAHGALPLCCGTHRRDPWPWLVSVPGASLPRVPSVFASAIESSCTRPDGSAIDTQIDGLEFPCPNPRGELVLHLKGLTKEDVPVGTEIWSSDG